MRTGRRRYLSWSRGDGSATATAPVFPMLVPIRGTDVHRRIDGGVLGPRESIQRLTLGGRYGPSRDRVSPTSETDVHHIGRGLAHQAARQAYGALRRSMDPSAPGLAVRRHF